MPSIAEVKAAHERAEKDALRPGDANLLSIYIQVLRKEAESYAQALENVREALGQSKSHYLVMPDDVKDAVSCLREYAVGLEDGGVRAKALLERLESQ